MKIGILTFHRPINYGAFLQAYSLSHQLQVNFPEVAVEIVDYIAPKEKRTIYLNILRTVKYYGVDAAVKELVKIKIFKKSLQNFNLSPKSFCKEDLSEIFAYINTRYDILIIGSDAVFNWNQNGYPTAFIPQYKFDIPVITYAASVHGLKFKELNRTMLNECATSFERMKYIGVRDKNTENFVKYCLQKSKPWHCCDPTILMDYNDLYKIKHRSFNEIMKAHKLSASEKYIVLMLEDQEISKEIREKYSNTYKIVTLFKKNKYADRFLYDLSPIEWALIIKNATLVVTNFFHGALIALTQNVPVIVIDLSNYNEPYEGKLKDLLERRFELPELYVKKSEWKNKEEEIFKTAEYAIQGFYNKKIINGVQNEKKSFEIFKNKINELIGEKEYETV